jgi:hypothetical protein
MEPVQPPQMNVFYDKKYIAMGAEALSSACIAVFNQMSVTQEQADRLESCDVTFRIKCD